MIVLNQKVILPKSHNNKDGVVTQVPKKTTPQSGIAQITNRVKVAYQDGHGGMTEAWFTIDSLEAWRSPKDITAELEAKYQAEMDAVNAEHDKEKLEWIDTKEEEPKKKIIDNTDKLETDNSPEFIG
jgi:hypothetical protein